MKRDFKQEQNYIKAKKRVKDIKGFYIHFIVYVIVNIFISSVIFYNLLEIGSSFSDVNNFGIYSTWIFWGIGVFFHWLGVFGFR